MNNIVSISDFRNNISDYINRVVYNNDSILIKKGKKVVAKVAAYKKEDKTDFEAKIKKYAGILSKDEAKKIKAAMKKFRRNFRITS